MIFKYGASSPAIPSEKNTDLSGISPMRSCTTISRRWTAMRNPSAVLVGAFRRHWDRLENAEVYSSRRDWILPE